MQHNRESAEKLAKLAVETDGGDIDIEEMGHVEITSVKTSKANSNGGNVTVAANGSITVNGAIDTSGKGTNGKGGNISLVAQELLHVTSIGSLKSTNSGTGTVGSINLSSGSSMTLAGSIDARHSSDGLGGNIGLTASGSITQTSGKVETTGTLTPSAGSPNAATFNSLGNKAGSLVIPNGKRVLVNGSFDSTGFVQVSGTIGGKGSVGTVTVLSGSVLSPGESPGQLKTGNLVFNSGSYYAVELNGPTAGTDYDQIAVTGTVNLGGANLVLTAPYMPTNGQVFKIIDNDGTRDDVTGTFNGFTSKARPLTSGPVNFTISYKGGDGNDVTLTAEVAPAHRDWT